MNFTDARSRIDHVAIIGAGFSGALQAINLVRHGGPRATLIERRGPAARGVAYAAAHPDHLLNVRASNMSALPDDPGDFERWLAAHHPAIQGFAPRILYGDYLGDLLDRTRAAAGDRLAMVSGEAIDVAFDGDGARVLLADGRIVAADAVVLAPGNLPPHEPASIAAAGLDADHYAADPWAGDVGRGLADDDVVLLIGTGLTMVDVALLLEAQGFRGRIVAQSRRGLLPSAHGTVENKRPIVERPPAVAVPLLRAVRRRAADIGWRAAVDELRPFTQDLWLAASIAERQRFLRHVRPWWDVHRHRLAPAVADRIAAMRARGQLHITAGKLAAVERDGSGLRVRWLPRGAAHARSDHFRRIINCSGPVGDLDRTADPLLQQLYRAGHIRPDPLHIGIDVSPRSEVIDAAGQANPRLIALGPPTRGTFWEIIAVPDIRRQTWSVARRFAHAEWVEGEGL